MKKTMIIGAVALVGLTVSGVESGVVGYNNMALAVGVKQIAGVPFQNTTGEALDIQDIVPLNNGAEIGDGEATLWYWDTDQKKYVYAFWTTDLYEDDGTEEGVALNKSGWCNNTDDLFIVEKSFASGQGFWILPNGNHASSTVQIAGKVLAIDTDRAGVALSKGTKQMIASPFPVSVELQDIVPLNNGTEIGDGEATIWWWDTASKKFVYAFWTTDLYEDDGTEEGKALNKAGWCNNTDDLFVMSHTFSVGEGFWILPNGNHSAPSVSYANPMK